MAEVSRRAGARLGHLVEPPLVLKAGNDLVPFWDIRSLQIDDIEHEVVVLATFSGHTYTAEGFDAIEAVMALKPSLLEGRRLRWRKGAWLFHNIVAHPIVGILSIFRLGRLAIRFHDWSTPRPR
jgi:hypothetical protein